MIIIKIERKLKHKIVNKKKEKKKKNTKQRTNKSNFKLSFIKDIKTVVQKPRRRGTICTMAHYKIA